MEEAIPLDAATPQSVDLLIDDIPLADASAPSDLAVVAPQVTALRIEEAAVDWMIGTVQRPAVIASYDDGTEHDVSALVSWQITPANALAQLPTGDLLALVDGDANVTAHLSTFTATYDLHVDYGFDFTSAVLPAGVVADSSGDTIYRQTSATTVEPIAPGQGVAIFENRGRGWGVLTFDAYDNRLIGAYGPGWPFALSSWDRISATGPTRVANVANSPTSTSVDADRLTDDSAQEAMGIYSAPSGTGHAVASIWLASDPTSPLGPLAMLSTSASGSRTDDPVTLSSTWTRHRVEGATGPLLTLRIAGFDAAATGSLLAWGASIVTGRYDLPLVDGATGHAGAATLQLPADSRWVVDGGIHWGGRFQQLVFDPRDFVPAPTADPKFVFSADTAQGRIALLARYGPASQIEWHFVVRDSDAIVSTYAPMQAGIGVGGSELDEVNWEVSYQPRQGTSFVRVGFNKSFHQTDGLAVGPDLTPPTSFYLGSNAGADGLAGLHREVRELSNHASKAPEWIIIGDSITDASALLPRPADFIFDTTQAQDSSYGGVYTLSVHGHTTLDQLATWQRYPDPQALTGAIILIGWNDLRQSGANIPQIRDHLQQLIDGLKERAPQMKIWLCAPTPGRTSLDELPNGAETLANWHILVQDITMATPYIGVDRWIVATNDELNDGTDALAPELDVGDGLHPNALGRRALGAIFRRELMDDGYLK